MTIIRHSILSLEDGLKYLNKWKSNITNRKVHNTREEINGVLVKTHSQRYVVFAENQICVSCGLKASYFAIEKGREEDLAYHINMYGIDEYGDEILFTKDHIIPKSKGGKNHISNYQLMCLDCNGHKGDEENINKTLEQFKTNKRERRLERERQTNEAELNKKLLKQFKDNKYIRIEKITSKNKTNISELEGKFYKYSYMKFKNKHKRNVVANIEEITENDYKALAERVLNEAKG